jgi:hypothetical protein
MFDFLHESFGHLKDELDQKRLCLFRIESSNRDAKNDKAIELREFVQVLVRRLRQELAIRLYHNLLVAS